MVNVIILLLFLQLSSSSKILCIFPSPLYSHQSVFQPIWSELSARGHNVTVLTPNPTKNSTLPNLREIDLNFTHKLVFDDLKMQYVINTESNLLVLMKHLFMVINNLTAEQLRHEEVKGLIRSSEEFDLMIVETHIPAWYGLSVKFSCPIIGITSMESTNFLSRAMGNIHNPIYSPHINMPFGSTLTFGQRTISILFEMMDELQNRLLFFPAQEKLIRESLQTDDLDLFALSRNLSLLLVNEIPGFSTIRPAIPSLVALNGLQIKPEKSLPSELQHFLDGAQEGVIYFSLGSSVKSYLISTEKQAMFASVFEELAGFRVIWKFEEDFEVALPNNVKKMVWAPQQDILRHKNVKLFITQGGIQSIEESLHFKVPMLGLPFFGDQFHNVIRMSELGLGQWLHFQTLTKQILKNSILQIVKNQSYYNNVSRFSYLLNNQPIRPIDKAVWWIEYVLRHKGGKYLRSTLADMPWYQYYLVDVVLFLLSVVIVIVGVVLLFCKFIVRKVKKLKVE